MESHPQDARTQANDVPARPAAGSLTDLQRALDAALAGDDAMLRPMLPAYGLGEADAALAVLRAFPAPGEASWVLTLLPDLLAHGARTPDPLMALKNWEQFLRAATDAECAADESGALHPSAADGDADGEGDAPAPEAVRRILAQLVWIEILTVLFSHSQFLADSLARHPDTFEWLDDPVALYASRPLEYYRQMARWTALEAGMAEGTPPADEAALHAALRRWQRMELFRIGARDVLGAAGVEQITGELSMLAESVIEMAWEAALAQMTARYGEPRLENPGGEDAGDSADDAARADAGAPCTMAVYGMGKLGGRELNFSSDVDLIFLYEGEGETAGRPADSAGSAAFAGRRDGISNHEFFTRVCEALIRFLSRRTEDGQIYRVDVRLRPEGHSGPLIRSIESFENYFFTQGRVWERAAYLKARQIAGGAALGRRFNRLVEGFCFTPETPERIRRNLAEIKSLIDGNLGPDGARLDVKRGRGGIRELEFSVAALQLIHGGREPALRPKNFWTAVDALHRFGLVSEDERARITAAYDFLRTIEHRLQIMEERQTHEMPAAEEERRRLAQRLGLWTDLPPRRRFDAFERRLAESREWTHNYYLATLDAKDEEEQSPEERVVAALYQPDPDAEVLLARLAPFGIEEKGAAECLLAMARGTSEVYVSERGQRLFRQVLPHALDECRRVPFPGAAIRNLDNFLHGAKGISSYYSLFLESAGVRKLILRLLGTSDYCARLLAARPELFDALLEWGLPPGADYGALIADYYRGSARSIRTLEGRLDFLRLFKQQEWLRIVLRDLFIARADAAGVAAELTRLAELCLGVAAEAAFERAAEKFQIDDASRAVLGGAWTIMGLGSFGGAMLSYFSDLDVVFLYELPEGADAAGVNPAEFFTAWANDVINIMSRAHERGDLFKADARLRPEGRNAPVIAPLGRYLEYYAKDAQTWEFQSAAKLRVVAGAGAPGERLREAVRALMAERFGAAGAWQGEMRAMRRRLEESVRLPEWAAADFKRGPGGLTDHDFIEQALLLRNAGALAEIPPQKIAAITALRERGLLGEDDAAALVTNFQFLKKLEARIRLMFETSEDLMPAEGARLRALAVAMSTAESLFTPESLRGRFEDVIAENRGMYEKIVGRE